MENQIKYTDENRTSKLIQLGFSQEMNGGFQTHELLNFIPKVIEFKKSLHRDGTVFIDWKKKTKFFIRFTNYMNKWGYDIVSNDDPKKSDQGQSNEQFVYLLADLICYLKTQTK